MNIILATAIVFAMVTLLVLHNYLVQDIEVHSKNYADIINKVTMLSCCCSGCVLLQYSSGQLYILSNTGRSSNNE
jgi:hypothetical protein